MQQEKAPYHNKPSSAGHTATPRLTTVTADAAYSNKDKEPQHQQQQQEQQQQQALSPPPKPPQKQEQPQLQQQQQPDEELYGGGSGEPAQTNHGTAGPSAKKPPPCHRIGMLPHSREHPPPESHLFPFYAKKDKYLNDHVYLVASSPMLEDHVSSKCLGAWCVVPQCFPPFIRYKSRNRCGPLQGHFEQFHPHLVTGKKTKTVSPAPPGPQPPFLLDNNERHNNTHTDVNRPFKRARLESSLSPEEEGSTTSTAALQELGPGAPAWADILNANLNQVFHRLNQQSTAPDTQPLIRAAAVFEAKRWNSMARLDSDPLRPVPDLLTGRVPSYFPSTLRQWRDMSCRAVQELLIFYQLNQDPELPHLDPKSYTPQGSRHHIYLSFFVGIRAVQQKNGQV